ncbi:MAG: tRNA (adenosine(37)-N6)-threonylcarbamoyltransferase complex transferase subunit TsaD [Oscillospiraceae bacterium]|nr:tRNA (adenosine(37)-N6)-threonylcarbamoyltransferase complex transferase subunit TsaD [Oscillospiraceae bacterium]
MGDVTILGIETSCDETAAAVVRNGREILSNVVLSQIGDHAAFGGVVPETASRQHLLAIVPVVDEAIAKSGVALGDIDAVAVTYGPGLVGSLLVGLSFAKGVARATGKPLIGVHHVAAHISAIRLTQAPPEPPFTALVVSGGHSSIYYVEDYRTYRLVGRTRDDAAGEAFDKVARAAGLGYPGGQKLEAAAAGGDPEFIRFPRTSFRDGTYDFSFSGVKTAAVNRMKKELGQSASQQSQPSLQSQPPLRTLSDAFFRDFCASYQAAVVDALVMNTMAAERSLGSGKIVVAGGVAANGALRERFRVAAEAASSAAEAEAVGKTSVYFPPPPLCTDNAAMVAARAYHDYVAGVFSPLTLNATSTAAI